MLDEFCTVTRYHRKYALRVAERAPSGTTAKEEAATTTDLRAEGDFDLGDDLGGRRLSLVGPTEGAAPSFGFPG